MATVDPVQYAEDAAKSARFTLPVQEEHEHAVKSLTALFSLLYSCPLFENLHPREKRRFVRKYITLALQDISDEGFLGAIRKWADFGNLFLRGFSVEGLHLTYEMHEDLKSSPIACAIRSFQRLSPSQDIFFRCVKWIYNWHIYLAKLPLSRPDLREPAETAWIERQTQVIDFTAIPYSLVEGLRLVVQTLYDKPFDPNVIGRHGPGSTNAKVKSVTDKEFCHNPSIQALQISTPSYITFVNPLREPENGLWQDVFKDYKSVRPITMESVSMQYAQQALKRQIYASNDSGLMLSGRFTKYADQGRSRRLALIGSKVGRSDAKPITVDLSSASDYLSAELVANVMPPGIVHELMCARTWRVNTPSKKTVEVAMYAGMGSATTFPVQTLIFTGIAIMATIWALCEKELGGFPGWQQATQDYLSRGTKRFLRPRRYFNSIQVYGDDIIVPEIATEKLFYLLERFGLRVNYDKSFFGKSAVREACGIFALAGEDITPVRYRIPVTHGLHDYASIDSLRSAANLAFESCYTVLYRYFVRTLQGAKVLRGNGRKFDKIPIVFEEYRGKADDYIGVISLRKPLCIGGSVFGHQTRLQLGLIGRTRSSFAATESYHYDQSLFLAHYEDILTVNHGKIPRGIRLVTRYAYPKSDGNGWAWVPLRP